MNESRCKAPVKGTRCEYPRRPGLMSRHIKNPHLMRTLDEQQRKGLLGVVFRLYGLYPLYLAMRLLGMKRRYWRIHRGIYMALHHQETLSWRLFLSS